MSEHPAAPVGPYALPPLRFGYADLEPVIDEATLRLHHGRHHQAYVDGVNAALLANPPWLGLTIEEILRRDLLAAIERDFGSFGEFKARFEEAGCRHFGSGWVFLVCRPKQGFRLEILTLANQDSVLSLPEPAPGLLLCDLWEHAYYLRYQNRRADWLRAWWDVVHWDHVAERLRGIREGRHQL